LCVRGSQSKWLSQLTIREKKKKEKKKKEKKERKKEASLIESVGVYFQ